MQTINEAASTATPPGLTNGNNTKPDPGPRKRPDRRRIDDPSTEAARFLAAVSQFMHQNGVMITPSSIDGARQLFRNFCKNSGLRGKDKERVRRIVESQIAQLKVTMREMYASKAVHDLTIQITGE